MADIDRKDWKVKGPESRAWDPWIVYKGQALREEGSLLNFDIELTLTTTVLTLNLTTFNVHHDLPRHYYPYSYEINDDNNDTTMTDPVPTPRGSSLAYPEMVRLHFKSRWCQLTIRTSFS